MNSQEVITSAQSLSIQEQKQILIEWIKNLVQKTTQQNLDELAKTELEDQDQKKFQTLLSLLDELTVSGRQPSLLDKTLSPSARQLQLPVTSDEEGRAIKRQQREEWLKANYANYAGKYIALDGNRLLGVGKNYVEARKAALQAGVKDAYIDFVHSPDTKGFMGGW